jgi:putative MATE family efflux protein
MQDLTTGPVSRHLLKTSSFMLVTMVFQTLYFLVDLYWVGRLGKEAVAAVGIAGNLMFVVLAITQMLGVGTTALIAHSSGQRNHDRALLVFNQALVFSVLVGALYFIVAMGLRSGYARVQSADAVTARLAGDYLLWFIPATALQFAMVVMGAALRGTGHFKPGMIVQTATVIINIVLAPILIFGWMTHHPLGVAGAAIATFIAVAVGTAWLTLYFLPHDSFLRFTPADWKPAPALWGKVLSIGLPAGAEFALMGVYVFVIYTITRPFGTAAQAGFGIGMRVVQAGFMPVVALGFAVAPVAGQNFGARHADRVRETFRTAVILAAVIMFVFALLCHVATAAMIRVFSSDPQVIAVGTEYLRIVSWNYVASGVVFVCGSMFQALGNTVPSLAASFVRMVLIIVPAFMLARLPGFKLVWIWWIAVAAGTLQVVLNLFLIRREMRIRLDFGAAPASAPRAMGSSPSDLGQGPTPAVASADSD